MAEQLSGTFVIDPIAETDRASEFYFQSEWEALVEQLNGPAPSYPSENNIVADPPEISGGRHARPDDDPIPLTTYQPRHALDDETLDAPYSGGRHRIENIEWQREKTPLTAYQFETRVKELIIEKKKLFVAAAVATCALAIVGAELGSDFERAHDTPEPSVVSTSNADTLSSITLTLGSSDFIGPVAPQHQLNQLPQASPSLLAADRPSVYHQSVNDPEIKPPQAPLIDTVKSQLTSDIATPNAAKTAPADTAHPAPAASTAPQSPPAANTAPNSAPKPAAPVMAPNVAQPVTPKVAPKPVNPSPVCKPNVQFAYNYFQQQHFSKDGAAGFVANMMIEDPGLIPDLVQGFTHSPKPIRGTGYGISQWTTESRQVGLENQAKNEPAPDNTPASLKTQLDFVMVELGPDAALLNMLTDKTPPSSPGQSAANKLAVEVMQLYERPKDHATGGPNAIARGKAADLIITVSPTC